MHGNPAVVWLSPEIDSSGSMRVDRMQASVKEAGIDKLPPPITPDNNPHTVPGQFDLNGNDQHGHIIAAGKDWPR